MTDYDDYQADNAPAWLSGFYGERWNRVFGLMKQGFAEAALAAMLARYPEYGPEDALEAQAEMRGLDPNYGDDSPTFRTRIKHAFSTWRMAGTNAGLSAALQRAGYVNFQIAERVARWWEFDLVIFAPFPWVSGSNADATWGDPGVWDDGGAWAYDVPDVHLARLRALVKKYKGTHARCRNIIIVFSGTTWDQEVGATWNDLPGATWDGTAAYVAA